MICYLSTSQEGKQREKWCWASHPVGSHDRRKTGKRNAGVSVIQAGAMTEGSKEKSGVVPVIQSEAMTEERKKREDLVLY